MSMIHWKRLIAILLAVCMTLSLGACAAGGQDTGEKGSTSTDGNQQESSGDKPKENQPEGMKAEGSMGRYVESEITMPEGEYRIMQTLSDGRLRILTSTGIYDSADQGDSWKAWEAQPEELSQDLTAEPEQKEGSLSVSFSIRGPLLGKDGSLSYYIKKDGAHLFKYINPKGEISQFTLEMPEEEYGFDVLGAGFTDTGDALYVDDYSNIYLIDCKAGSIKHVFEADSESGIMNVFAVGDQLFRISNNYISGEDGTTGSSNLSIKTYSLSSYEQIEGNKSFVDFISSGAGLEGDDYSNEFFNIPDSDAFYIVNKSGIYRYSLSSSVVEKIFDGNMGEMNSSYVQGGTAVDQDHYYISYYGTENRLIKYAFDPDMLSVPEQKLTVYSLYDNIKIRELITKFQKSNPDVYVAYEVGLSGSDGMTESDAIKSLNTNIMAGEGPDILVLDGLPLGSYQEKGMLADIGDVIEEVSKESGLFENIAAAYEKDGKIQAVPLGFSVPVIMGRKDSIDKITDLDSFIKQQEALADKGGISILSSMDTHTMLKIFMSVSSPAWIKQDGSLDESKIKEFLTGMQKLVEISKIPDEKKSDMSMEEGIEFEITQFMTTGELYVGNMLDTKTDQNVFQMKNSWNLYGVYSVLKQRGEDFSYKTAPGQSSGIYVPLMPIGLNAKSENGDTAKRFLRYMIGPDSNLSVGWPVNKKVFSDNMAKPDNLQEGTVNSESQDGTLFEYTAVWPSQDAFKEFEKLAESLDTPSETDNMINRTVLEEGDKCLRGEATVEEAATSIMSKINLYLSE